MNIHLSDHWKVNLRKVPLLLSLMALIIFIYDFGVRHNPGVTAILHGIYQVLLFVIAISYIAFYVLFFPKKQKRSVWIFDIVLVSALLWHFITSILLDPELRSSGSLLHFLALPFWNKLLFVIVFVREVSLLKMNFKGRQFNPALLFILSFIAIIFAGTLLLLLPNATYGGISLIDAFFTSTSAVCVTGLIVVDTATYFTPTGQTIIMLLIQVGGLGIMTFTSFFAYFFQDSSSFKSQLMLQDITNTEKIAEVFRTLKKVIILTFGFEFFGAVFIFFTVDARLFATTGQQMFFSVFHSISGFCNAGFSTLTLGLYDPGLRFNYFLLFIIAALFITGGIGFPILFNYIKYLKHVWKNRWARYNRIKFFTYLPGIININTRIVIATTFALIVAGTLLLFLFEFNNTLAEHPFGGKLVTAFFTAAVPRTAGFNSVDMNALHFSTIMIIFFLMWVGGSPASTAGGIKTSTLALATLNIISIARGSRRVEAYRREISAYSIRRAFAIISLSLIAIGVAVFLIAFFDPEKDLLQIAFECFSAYSTVGLSLGITPHLSVPSKLVIILTMFAGRVGMLTVMVALMRKVIHVNRRYPAEEILIN